MHDILIYHICKYVTGEHVRLNNIFYYYKYYCKSFSGIKFETKAFGHGASHASRTVGVYGIIVVT